MANLPLTTIELVSTQRTVPLNGSPSSQEYNDDQNESLIDLTSLTTFINGTLIPLLQVLPGVASTTGLEGRAVNTNSTDLTDLCWNALTSTPLTIAQSLSYLKNLIDGQQGTVTDLSVQVAALSSKLSSTNQNDIALALQHFQAVLNNLTAEVLVLQGATFAAQTASMQQTSTAAVSPLGENSVAVLWRSPFANDLYTVVCSVADATGSLAVDSWAYIPGGSGITVAVTNSDTVTVHTGVIHAVAYPSN